MRWVFQSGQAGQGSLRTAPVSRQNVTAVSCQAMGQGHSEHMPAAVKGGIPEGWDGKAGERIVAVIESFLGA